MPPASVSTVATAVNEFGLPRPALVGFLIAAAYGASDEVHQAFVPGRSPMPTDVLIDATGAFIGVSVWWYLGRRRTRSQHERSRESE